jgi:hypothetical protein
MAVAIFTAEVSMKLGELIEFAGIVSKNSPRLITSSNLSLREVDPFADAYRALLAIWGSRCDQLDQEIPVSPPLERQLCWERSQPVFVDVFAGGLVARVWGAIITAASRRRNAVTAEKQVRDLVAQHDALEQRFLRLMVNGPEFTLERVLALDRLRRKIERWSDLFVGHLMHRFGLTDFAVDLARALEFGEEQLAHPAGDGRAEAAWEMYFLCLRTSFRSITLPKGEAAQQRTQLLNCMLATFPGILFSDDGLLTTSELSHYFATPVAEGPSPTDVISTTWTDPFRKRAYRIDHH